MSETRQLLERVMQRVELRSFTLERFHDRRDRKRRNQRIAAGVVGIGIFVAAVWIVTTAGSFDRTQTPAATGPAATGPAETGPAIVFPDPTDQPSGTDKVCPGGIMAIPKVYGGKWEKGEVVLDFGFGHATSGELPRFLMTVYADGRLITRRMGMPDNPHDGRFVQRLTPNGVELVRSEVLSTGLFEQDLHLGGARGLQYGEAIVFDGDRLVRLSWGYVYGDACPEGAAAMMPSGEQASALKRLDSRLEDLGWLPASAWEDEVARRL